MAADRTLAVPRRKYGGLRAAKRERVRAVPPKPPPAMPHLVARIPGHRDYDFGTLAACFGEPFCIRLTADWERAFAAEPASTTANRVYMTKHFLNHLSAESMTKPTGPAGRVVPWLSAGCRPHPEAASWFHDAVVRYNAAMNDTGNRDVLRSNARSTRTNYLSMISGTLRTLSAYGSWPSSDAFCPLPGVDEDSVPSLMELRWPGQGRWPDGRVVLTDLLMDPRVALALGIDPAKVCGFDVQARIKSMARLNEVRLQALRACAAAELEEAHRAKRVGDAYLARSDFPTPEGFFLIASSAGCGHATRLLAKLEAGLTDPLEGDEPTRLRAFLACFLRRMDEREHGEFWNSFRMREAIRLSGGPKALNALLGVSSAAFTAAQTLMLIDTVLNCSVLDRLGAEPVSSAVRRGKVVVSTIEAIKMRSRGKSVETNLLSPACEECEMDAKGQDGRISGLAALRMWQELSDWPRDRARAAAGRDGPNAPVPVHELLWIAPVGGGGACTLGEVRQPDVSTQVFWFNAFLNRNVEDPIIGGLAIQRRMIRKTALQVRDAGNGFDFQVAKLAANHSGSATTAGYLRSGLLEMHYFAQIRRFQDLMEAMFVDPASAVAKSLGRTVDEAETLRATAVDMGFGFLCSDPFAGARIGVRQGERCGRVDECTSCPLLRFEVGDGTLETLWLAHRALESARPGFEQRNPTRWKAAWLPWLALTVVVIGRLEAGRHGVRWSRASARALAKLEAGSVSLPVLW